MPLDELAFRESLSAIAFTDKMVGATFAHHLLADCLRTVAYLNVQMVTRAPRAAGASPENA